ncbi:peptidyl-Lys metalloendopeptidase [Ramicandelaber brevisporus]|nr:peptidyl-Lys metalloendopeptidase [Ramicandelaber brevisporus]
MRFIQLASYMAMVAITATTSFVADTQAISFVGCSATQQNDINTAAANAQRYAADASRYLNSHTSATPRYTTWFGTYTASRHNTVRDHFNKISGNHFSSYTYDCSTCHKPKLMVDAHPSKKDEVRLCPDFWHSPATGTDSKAGTIIHAASLFTANGGTKQHKFGQSDCNNLAKSNPDEAIRNADSYRYFAENTPPLA